LNIHTISIILIVIFLKEHSFCSSIYTTNTTVKEQNGRTYHTPNDQYRTGELNNTDSSWGKLDFSKYTAVVNDSVISRFFPFDTLTDDTMLIVKNIPFKPDTFSSLAIDSYVHLGNSIPHEPKKKATVKKNINSSDKKTINALFLILIALVILLFSGFEIQKWKNRKSNI
jgi:hypothetical protein